MSAYFSEPSLGYNLGTSSGVSLLKGLVASLKASLMSQLFVEFTFHLVCSPWICLCFSNIKSHHQLIKFKKHIKFIIFLLYGDRCNWYDHEEIFAKLQLSNMKLSKPWQRICYFIIKYDFFRNEKVLPFYYNLNPGRGLSWPPWLEAQ